MVPRNDSISNFDSEKTSGKTGSKTERKNMKSRIQTIGSYFIYIILAVICVYVFRLRDNAYSGIVLVLILLTAGTIIDVASIHKKKKQNEGKNAL